MKKIAFKLSLAATAAILLGGSLYFLDATSARETKPAVNMPLDKSASASIEGFRFLDQELTGIKMRINASKATLKNRKFRQFRIATSQVLEMDEPTFKIYDEKNEATEISGRCAVVDPIKKAVLFTKGAIVRQAGGKTLKCDRLSWKYKEGALAVDGPFVLAKGDETTKGNGLYADMSLQALIHN